MRNIIGLLFLLVIVASFYSLIGMMVAHLFSLSGKIKSTWWIVHSITVLAMFLGMFLTRAMADNHPVFLEKISLLIMGFYSIFIVIGFISLVGKIFFDGYFWAYFALSLTVLIFSFSYYTALYAPLNIVNANLQFKDLPEDLNGIRILMISDMHIGAFIQKDYVERIANAIQAEKPDLMVMAGDLSDGRAAYIRPFAQPLSKLKVPLGIWAITGNHEYYWGAESLMSMWKELGVHVLMDEAQSIAIGHDNSNTKLNIFGLKDYMASPNRLKLSEILPTKKIGNEFNLLLAHQPKIFDELDEKFKIDLVLSGHTHSGQYFPYTWLIYLFQKYVYGHYMKNQTQLWVSHGVGFWGPPLRSFHAGELVIFTLLKRP